MTSFTISVDLSGVLNALDEQVQVMFPTIAQAVAMTAEHGAEEWKKSVWNAKLWVNEKDEYIKSIQWKMTGNFSAEIWTDYKYANEIETGRPAYDLKKMLQTSRKTRQSKSGSKYLIIPFRHNTPGNDALTQSMPKSVYATAKGLTPSVVLPPGSKKPATRLSASGHQVAQHSYQWGGRLPAGMLGPNPKGKVDRYAGMVKMNTSSGKQKSSAYLTFRNMSEKSTGWIVPAKPGLHLAKKVSDGLQPVLEAAIGKVVIDSLK